MRKKYSFAIAAVAGIIGLLGSQGPAVADPSGLSRARAGTLAFHDVEVAKHAGYGLLKDAAGIACIDNPGVGAMGIHYVKPALIGNPVEDPARPEALVYEPQPNGKLRLVAAEYIVLKSVWEGAGHTAPPALFGRQFELNPSPNRFGLPPFYELHAWIWKHNPSGKFSDWNPLATCAFA